MEPEVLVLDEPTAGLDPEGVHDLVGFINSLSKTYGMTVIFSTHDVSIVAEVADYIYVMNKGKFVAEGSVRGDLPASRTCSGPCGSMSRSYPN